MIQAESLHREVAQFSNSLHTFDDDDIAGVKPVIEKIVSTRNSWKEIRLKIAHFEKFGTLPQEKLKEKIFEGTAAELKVQLDSTQAKIRKLRWKINNNPAHHKEASWKQELAMLEAVEQSTKMQILQQQYAKS